jgi:hypothetical protein
MQAKNEASQLLSMYEQSQSPVRLVSDGEKQGNELFREPYTTSWNRILCVCACVVPQD